LSTAVSKPTYLSTPFSPSPLNCFLLVFYRFLCYWRLKLHLVATCQGLAAGLCEKLDNEEKLVSREMAGEGGPAPSSHFYLKLCS